MKIEVQVELIVGDAIGPGEVDDNCLGKRFAGCAILFRDSKHAGQVAKNIGVHLRLCDEFEVSIQAPRAHS